MWIALSVFLLISSACFGILMLLMRAGRNRDHEVLAGRQRRPLIFGALTEAFAGALPLSTRTRKQLAQFVGHAGHYHRQALAEFLALRNAMVMGWVLVVAAAIAVAVEPGDPLAYQLALGGLLVAAALYSLPRLFLEAMAKNRVQRIEEALPDALDMITMCMSGGLPLQSAMTRVSDELESTHPDLAFELRIVGRQMEAGSLDSAIQQFAKRIDAAEVHSLAAIVGQTGKQGASVAAAFELFADNVRLNRRQRGDEAGNKTAVKMLFPLVFCLAPPVYLMLLSPAAIELREFVKRESTPGGALSASAENIAPLLEGSPLDSDAGRRSPRREAGSASASTPAPASAVPPGGDAIQEEGSP